MALRLAKELPVCPNCKAYVEVDSLHTDNGDETECKELYAVRCSALCLDYITGDFDSELAAIFAWDCLLRGWGVSEEERQVAFPCPACKSFAEVYVDRMTDGTHQGDEFGVRCSNARCAYVECASMSGFDHRGAAVAGWNAYVKETQPVSNLEEVKGTLAILGLRLAEAHQAAMESVESCREELIQHYESIIEETAKKAEDKCCGECVHWCDVPQFGDRTGICTLECRGDRKRGAWVNTHWRERHETT